jgi:uridine kinase
MVSFSLIIVLKLLLLALFSSGYQDALFIPFVMEYLNQGGNPWEYPSMTKEAFPYPPLMLYVLSAFLFPLQFFPNSPLLESLLYGLPLLLSDLLIAAILIKMFVWHKTEIFIFYFTSPIILYSTFMHGQLDILPTAILFTSIYFLSKKYYLGAAIIAGLAISTKFHTIAALPLMAIFLLNQGKIKEAIYIILIPIIMYFAFALPYLNYGVSFGYSELVLHNQKQNMLFDSYFTIGNMKIYLPLLIATFIYLRFSAFQKINTDLLYAFIGALFSVFLLFIEPSPAWFVWITPFFTIFYIRYFNGIQPIILHGLMMTFYLAYYLFFHQYDYPGVLFLGYQLIEQPLDLDLPVGNILFTSLQAVLLVTIYQFYKYSTQSNDIYTMEKSFILGIGGDSGAGKSTLINNLKYMLNDSILELEGDSNHKWERGHNKWQDFTHLNPKANSLHQQAEQVVQLKNRKTIQRADYNHATGTFTDTDKIRPKDFIVLAGLHPFYLPIMRKIIDLKIFLDLDERLRTSWKILRDSAHRGHTEADIIQSLKNRQPDSEKYIHPQKLFSDIVISLFPTDEDKFVGLHYHGELGMSLAMNASIPLDQVIQAFKNNGCDITWDYSPDLNTQYLIFNKEPSNLDIAWYVATYIKNSSELVSSPNWQAGYAGIIQFLILFAISEIMQERVQRYA